MPGKIQIFKKAKRFQSLQQAIDLAVLLKKELFQLELISLNPKYEHFNVPKSHAGFREIEDPNRVLKSLQTMLNEYLQCCYYLIRPGCVHGFTISAKGEEGRGILTNASKHINCRYLVKMDFSDFFHQCKAVHLNQIYSKHFPGFEKDLCQLLNALFLYNGRLAMGAPTSPVLSNFAMEETDLALMKYSEENQINFTRYADDLCFSSQSELSQDLIDCIMNIIKSSGFALNSNKLNFYSPEEEKEITGLVVGANQVTLPHEYLPSLEKEVSRFTTFCEVESRYRMVEKKQRMQHFERELRGKIAFAEYIMPEYEQIIKLSDSLDKAKELLDHSESVSWLERPYGFFHK